MKRFIISLFLGTFLMIPVAVLADHDTAHTIQQLQAKIQALQDQIGKIQQLPKARPMLSPQPAEAVIFEQPQNISSFNRDLYFGIKNNSDVTDLQELLTDQGYYAGPVSGNFGLLTLSAVKKFQSANGINPTGYFGPRSRAVANSIVQKLVGQICPQEEGCEGNILPSAQLKITTDSDLRGMVSEYFSAVFNISGGSGNYLTRGDGYIPGLTFAVNEKTGGAMLYGNPNKSGVYSFVVFAEDIFKCAEGEVCPTPAFKTYGKERFTIVIKDKISYGNPPVVSGIKGPTALKVGEEGIWTVGASDSNSGSLNYKVIWGDEVYGLEAAGELAPQATPFRQTATFSHIYYRASVYNPVFYIVNDRGQEAKTSISVNVGEVTPTTISEQVKCVFNGATTEQKCYRAADIGDSNISCSGIGACTVSINGNRGDKIVWKSSCGGYAYTIMDGQNEYAQFSCAPSVQPFISSIQPNSGPIGAQVTLTGTGFTLNKTGSGCESNASTECAVFSIPTNTVHFGPATISDVRSYDGKTLYFQVPDGYSPPCGNTVNCLAYAELLPGAYNVSVTNSNGTSNTVNFTVTSGNVIAPSITVLSPNGGETWANGTTQTIKWQDNTPVPLCPVGAQCAPQAPKYYNIKLVSYSQPCTGLCPAYYPAPYTIAKNVYGSSYSWSVGKYLDVLGTVTGGIAPDGSYTVQVCQSGTTTCDSSDSYFKIISGGTSTNNSPVINNIPAVPVSINVGQSVPFSWGATDADGDNLSWGVSWGEGTGVAGACQSPNPQNKQGWTYNTSHAWSNPGTYTVKATVNDCRGGSDDHVFNVTVVGATQPSITVLSPNGGEIWAMGESQTVKWSGSNGTRVNITLLNIDKTKEVYGLAMTVINDGSEVIKVPYDLSAGRYYLRVSCVENCSPEVGFDDSDAPFSIISESTTNQQSTTTVLMAASILTAIQQQLNEIAATIKNLQR